MTQLHGKQLRNESIVLDKLSGLGSATFSTGASMIFQSGTTLRRDTNGISENTDVVNKEYVDSIASGLDVKEAARLLSDVNISGTYDNGSGGVGAKITLSDGTLNIDGVAVTNGDRVVLNGQTDDAHNGIYDVSGVSSTVVLTRSEDFDGSPSKEINGGEFVFIKEGNDYADTGFVVSTPNDTITIGTDNINFTQFSAAGVITPGLGLVYGSGTSIDVNTGTGLTISNDAVILADTTVSAGSYGSADTVSTFTVDDQGRLTAAGDTTIDITASQVSDFDTEVNSEVFDSSNFIDSATVDFNVTTGASVSADVKVNPGTGLTVSASGVEINYGSGLTVSGNQLVVDITPQGGLTFSASGATASLQVAYDSNTLSLVGGALTVIAGSAQPFYQLAAVGATAVGSNGFGDPTGITLSKTPNDYSRIEVYVNGQRQFLGSENTSADCWFGATGSSVEFISLVEGQELYWNSQSAGFTLETTDRVEIVYEF